MKKEETSQPKIRLCVSKEVKKTWFDILDKMADGTNTERRKLHTKFLEEIVKWNAVRGWWNEPINDKGIVSYVEPLKITETLLDLIEELDTTTRKPDRIPLIGSVKRFINIQFCTED